MRHQSIIYTLAVSLFFCPIFAQEHYSVEHSHTGLKDILYTSLNKGKATELAAELSLQDTLNPFKVYGTDIAPFLGYTKEYEGYQKAYQLAITSANLSSIHYMLIHKDYPVQEGDKNYFTYKIHIKWPAETMFDTLSGVIKEALRSEIETLANQVAASGSIRANESVEIQCIDAFIEKIRKLKSSGLSLDEAALLSAGFIEIPIEGVSIENTDSLSTLDHDYAGLKIGGVFVRHNAGVAADSLSAQFSMVSIFSDNQSVASGLFNTANEAFEASNEKIIAWYHFFESTGGNKMFYKFRSTITQEEAELFIEAQYQELLLRLGIVEDEEPVSLKDQELHQSRSISCFNYKEWRALHCLIPYASGFVPFTGGSEYGFGVTCGIVDGFYELIILLLDLQDGVISILEHSPFSIFWFIEAGKEIFKACSFMGFSSNAVAFGVYNKVKADTEYWTSLYQAITHVIQNANIKVMLNNIWTAIKDAFKGITFQSGTALAGYYAGLIVFEIILAYFTGGTVQIAKITQKGLQGVKNIFKPAMTKDVLSDALQNAPSSAKVKAWIVIEGCFLAGTPVWVAGPPITGYASPVTTPIETVQLLDYVLAHENINTTYSLLADRAGYADPFDIDPYTSHEQRLRDNYDISASDWYEVAFEKFEGTSSCRLALTRDWINRRGYAEGHTVQLSLPEQGIEGLFRITHIRQILPRSRPVYEESDEDYGYRPVMGIFVHQSADVLRLSFDTGPSIGVTFAHPVYSLTTGGWRLAGELRVGEKVLARSGEMTVTGSERLEGMHTVYNLEVKDVHNFLVGDAGVVVHNNCTNWNKINHYISDGGPKKAIDHVFDNHKFNTIKPNKSKYSSQISSSKNQLEDFLNDVVLKLNPAKIDFEGIHPRAWVDASQLLLEPKYSGIAHFGTTSSGSPTNILRIVFDNANDLNPWTAFPVNSIGK